MLIREIKTGSTLGYMYKKVKIYEIESIISICSYFCRATFTQTVIPHKVMLPTCTAGILRVMSGVYHIFPP